MDIVFVLLLTKQMYRLGSSSCQPCSDAGISSAQHEQSHCEQRFTVGYPRPLSHELGIHRKGILEERPCYRGQCSDGPISCPVKRRYTHKRTQRGPPTWIAASIVHASSVVAGELM